LSIEDIFGDAFISEVYEETKPAEDAVKAATGEFVVVIKEVIRPAMEEYGKSIEAEGNAYEIEESDDPQAPEIRLTVRIKGEEYTGKNKPSCLLYEFNHDSANIRQWGWVTVPSKKNLAKIFAIALYDSEHITSEVVREHLVSFMYDITDLAASESSFVRIPIFKP